LGSSPRKKEKKRQQPEREGGGFERRGFGNIKRKRKKVKNLTDALGLGETGKISLKKIGYYLVKKGGAVGCKERILKFRNFGGEGTSMDGRGFAIRIECKRRLSKQGRGGANASRKGERFIAGGGWGGRKISIRQLPWGGKERTQEKNIWVKGCQVRRGRRTGNIQADGL